MKKLLDNMDKFLIMARCCDESRANFSRAIARKEWGKISEVHFSLFDSFLAKMNRLNDELREKR